MDYCIRNMKASEYPLLNDFLYEAIFVSEGMQAPPRSIVYNPELQLYVYAFGSRNDDRALVVEVGGKVIGVVWVRLMRDYGYVDDKTPSFAISLYKDYRGFGIGRVMMKNMLTLLQNCGYIQASLAVQKDNYATKLYLSLGFEVIEERSDEFIMIYRFTNI